MLESLKARYRRIGISEDVYASGIVVTADTGYANEANNSYVKDAGINAYIPDQQFRSRDPKFKHQKTKHGKRHHDKVKGIKAVIPASEFTFDAVHVPGRQCDVVASGSDPRSWPVKARV